LADGRITFPFGKRALGRATYDAAGNMAVQIMNQDRPRFASEDKSLGDPEEMRSALSGYEAYFGRYRIDEKGQTVLHTLEGALFPNWVGGTQTRFFRLEGNRLELRTPEMPYSGTKLTAVLVWERLGESEGA